MIIILDTCIIVSDFRLSGTAFHTLLSTLEKTGNSVFVPQVVIDEVRNKHREEYNDTMRTYEKAAASLQRLAGFSISLSARDQDASANEYHTYLMDRLGEAGATVLPYPAVSHSRIVERALARRKPFRKDGQNGYRDALVWETVLEVSKIKNEKIVLITNNTKDFAVDGQKGESGDKQKFHPDLIDDLGTEGIDVSRIELYSCLGDFVDKEITPTLEFMSRILDELNAGTYRDLNLTQYFEDHLYDLIVTYEGGEIASSFPDDFEDPSLTGYYDILKVEAADVRRLNENDLIIRAVVFFDGEYEGYASRSEVYSLEDYYSLRVRDRDWYDHCAVGTMSRETIVTVDLTFSQSTHQVTSSEITDLSLDRGYLELWRH